jgi:hypothetical protein
MNYNLICIFICTHIYTNLSILVKSGCYTARGHSGGILLGVKKDCVKVGAFDEGEQFLSALLRNKKDGFKWEVIVVYGPAHHDKSRDFFGEV